MNHNPGADELRIRGILRQRGVGPDAPPAAVPPKPTGRPRDWLDDILNSPPTPAEPEPAAEPEPPAPESAKAKPSKARAARKRRRKASKRRPDESRTAWDTQVRDPRQSLIEAFDRVPYRLKWLAYHSTAAYLGWSMGLVGWSTYVTAWIAETGLVGFQAFFWYGAATCTFLLYRRTRGWWWPLAWLTAVPVTSTVTGVLLYAPHP